MQIPFFRKIVQSERFLLAGCGGGFDMMTAIPLYFYLRSLGKEVILANLSFIDLPQSSCDEVFDYCYLVNEKSEPLTYFPEKLLFDWLTLSGEKPIIYGFRNRIGVIPLCQIYVHLKEKHQIDTLVLADGGTDSLMFGDEFGVATIVEDSLSILASAKANCQQAYLMAVGFGVEKYHGLDHYPCLQNIATLIKQDAYLGAFSVTPDMPEGKKYLDFFDYVTNNSSANSIVYHSIVNAMRGEFGDFHTLERTKDSEQFINPLMPLSWHFELNALANNIVFADRVTNTYTLKEFYNEFQKHRIIHGRRKVLESYPFDKYKKTEVNTSVFTFKTIQLHI